MNHRKTVHRSVRLSEVKAKSDCNDAQGRLERVRVSLAGEVIAARTNKSRAEDRTRRDFLFQVEIILQRMGTSDGMSY
jgi:hypothetical protein